VAMNVCDAPDFQQWGNNWISNEDRSAFAIKIMSDDVKEMQGERLTSDGFIRKAASSILMAADMLRLSIDATHGLKAHFVPFIDCPLAGTVTKAQDQMVISVMCAAKSVWDSGKPPLPLAEIAKEIVYRDA